MSLEYFHRLDTRGLQLINKALITLLPKVDGAKDIKDFRPVSLVHGAVKIFMKALSVRLADDLPQMISMQQSAFVRPDPSRTINHTF